MIKGTSKKMMHYNKMENQLLLSFKWTIKIIAQNSQCDEIEETIYVLSINIILLTHNVNWWLSI